MIRLARLAIFFVGIGEMVAVPGEQEVSLVQGGVCQVCAIVYQGF